MSTAAKLAPDGEVRILAPVPAPRDEFLSRFGNISRQSSTYFAGTIFVTVVGYFLKIYVARALGAEALGLYALGMTIVGFIGIFNSLGLPAAAARFVAAYLGRNEEWKLAPFLRGSLALLIAVNAGLAVLVLTAGRWLAAHFYHTPALAHYLWAFAAIMFVGVLNVFLGQALAGFGDVSRRTLITHFTATAITASATVVLISLGAGLTGYLAAQVASAVVVVFLLALCVWKTLPRELAIAASTPKVEREVLNFSAAAYGVAGLQFVFSQTDLVVLGHYFEARQVGIYAIAMALVGFVPIALDSVNQIFAPTISELHAAGNCELLQRLYSTLTKWIVILTFPLALTMVVFAGTLLSIFGPAFGAGAIVVMIGTLGQFVNCAVGSVGYLLLMSGNQSQLVKVQAISAALLVVMDLALVPHFGIAGAVVATAFTTIASNLWLLRSVRSRLGMFPYHKGYFKLIAPALGSIAGVLLIARNFRGAHWQWAAAGLAMGIAYVVFLGMIVLGGLEHDDREIARAMRARFGNFFQKFSMA
jgi:O-antigen/teichoic acid export membrane protein